jgi:hypothetical protein
MKFLNYPQKVIISFLIAFLLLLGFMIIRLELKAASLQSRWEEHQKSLKKNEDILDNLNYFWRKVKKGQIILDDNYSSVEYDESEVTLYDKRIILKSKGDVNIIGGEEIKIGHPPNHTVFYTKKDGDIAIAPSHDKRIGYQKKEDFIFMLNNGSRVFLGEAEFSPFGKSQGIHVISKDLGPKLSVNHNGIVLRIQRKQGEFCIVMSADKDYINISKGESVITLEKENIDIQAKGDINLKSINGNVNIDGKKISLNE